MKNSKLVLMSLVIFSTAIVLSGCKAKSNLKVVPGYTPAPGEMTYQECVNKGGVILESLPQRCILDGKTVTNMEPTSGDAAGTREFHPCTSEEKANQACTKEYMPVCGSDGQTYGNGCSACAEGLDSWMGGECTVNPSPDDSDVNVIKLPTNTGIVGKKVVYTCTEEEKKNTICTMEYVGVCGDDGITYATGCTACASGKVESYVVGECNAESDMAI